MFLYGTEYTASALKMASFIMIQNLLKSVQIVPCRTLSNKSAIFSKPHRSIYARLYPTALVNPDGSAVYIRFPEPKKIVRLPLDLSTLSEEDRKLRLERRRPKKRVVIQEDIKDDFDSNRYLKFVKRKK